METSVKPESLASQGRKSIDKIFQIEFDGQKVYDLLELLENNAIGENCYLRVRQAVAFAEIVREQARAQGF